MGTVGKKFIDENLNVYQTLSYKCSKINKINFKIPT